MAVGDLFGHQAATFCIENLGFVYKDYLNNLHRELRIPLQGLPQQLWSGNVLRCIGEDIGIYLDHDRSYIESDNIATARILVHLNMREGLVESLHLQYRELITW